MRIVEHQVAGCIAVDGVVRDHEVPGQGGYNTVLTIEIADIVAECPIIRVHIDAVRCVVRTIVVCDIEPA
jgi:hypothetical protein